MSPDLDPDHGPEVASPEERPTKGPIGDAVRQRRLAIELTQTQLAYLTGVSGNTIGNLETGGAAPRRATVETVQAVLGWASGSFERLRSGRQPVEIFPPDLLNVVINEWVFGQVDANLMASSARRLRTHLSEANQEGRFTEQSADALKKFLFAISDMWLERVADEDVLEGGGVEELRDDLLRRLYASIEIAPEQPTLRHFDQMMRDLAPAAQFAQDLEPPQAASTHTRALLPTDVEELLAGAQIIDHGTLADTQGENTAVIALLIKKDAQKPFSRHDVDHIVRFQQIKAAALANVSKPTPAEFMTAPSEPEDYEDENDPGAEADHWAQQEIDRRRGK